MGNESQAYQLLMLGVGELATGTGNIQQRLRSALLEFHELEIQNFPSDEARHKFNYLMKGLGVENSGRDQVSVSANSLSDLEAAQYARRIYDLFLDMAREYFRQR